MAAGQQCVYVCSYCVVKPNALKAMTGIYFAKKGPSGIWYWVRKQEHATVLTEFTTEQEECVKALPGAPPGAMVGFVSI